MSQALYVVAKLGIPDRLSEGPQDIDELAQATTTHALTLFRLLRFLTGASQQNAGETVLGLAIR